MPSIENRKNLGTVEVVLDSTKYYFDVYNTSLGDRFLRALDDNLVNQRILEKNFCFLGFAGTKRNLSHLCKELNDTVAQINSFKFDPPYEKIHPFRPEDFQYSDKLPIGVVPAGEEYKTPGLRLKHESCNLLHRYFEELQGTAWNLSDFYKQADAETKYAIRQLNNLCHEIESWVLSHRKMIVDPEWIRPSQITTFLNAPRKELADEDFELFKKNRYDREFGGVYLHWSQVGKTLFEVFRDEDGKKLDDATCSAINHQKYFSGEFDVEWGNTINESNAFKKKEMDNFREWLSLNNFDWEDPKLALGYIKLGQVDLDKSFGSDRFQDVLKTLGNNLNIKSIKIKNGLSSHFDYRLGDKNWITIQKQFLKPGYDWSSKNG